MNPMQFAEQLKSVPDQALISEMQREPGSVPKYVVLAELQRRKGMRQNPPGPQAQPQTTVVQDTIAQSGLGQVAPRGFADGGRVHPLYGEPWLNPPLQDRVSEWGLGLWEKLKENDWKKSAKKPWNYFYNFMMGHGISDEDAVYRKPATTKVLENLFNVNQGKPVSKLSPTAVMPDEFSPPIQPDTSRLSVPKPPPAAATGTGAAAPSGLAAAAEILSPASLGFKSLPEAPSLPELSPIDLKMVTDQWKKDNPNLVADLQDKYLKQLEEDKISKDDMGTMAMLRMGIGMMTSKSPSFLGGAGEGAAAALAGYENELKQNKLVNREIMKAQLDFARDEMNYNSEASRQAMALAEYQRARTMEERQAVIQKYNLKKAEIDSFNEIVGKGLDERYRRDKMTSDERIAAGRNAATIEAAKIGASARASTGGFKESEIVAAIKLLSETPSIASEFMKLPPSEQRRRAILWMLNQQMNRSTSWGAASAGGLNQPVYDLGE